MWWIESSIFSGVGEVESGVLEVVCWKWLEICWRGGEVEVWFGIGEDGKRVGICLGVGEISWRYGKKVIKCLVYCSRIL